MIARNKKLDQFYTKEEIAKKYFLVVLNYIKNNNISYDKWLEPSAGTGSFLNLIKEPKIGIDLEPKSSDIFEADFLEFELPKADYVTIGNPPFGKNSSLALKFLNKASEQSKLVGFILPKTFKKTSLINRINPNLHLVFEEDLPKNSFLFENQNYNVPCVFQLWESRNYLRDKISLPATHEDFTFTTKENANFAIQRVGNSAGKVKEEFSHVANTSHYFIKANSHVLAKFKAIDWSTVKYNTAGNPSISKCELVKVYSSI